MTAAAIAPRLRNIFRIQNASPPTVIVLVPEDEPSLLARAVPQPPSSWPTLYPAWANLISTFKKLVLQAVSPPSFFPKFLEEGTLEENGVRSGDSITLQLPLLGGVEVRDKIPQEVKDAIQKWLDDNKTADGSYPTRCSGEHRDRLDQQVVDIYASQNITKTIKQAQNMVGRLLGVVRGIVNNQATGREIGDKSSNHRDEKKEKYDKQVEENGHCFSFNCVNESCESGVIVKGLYCDPCARVRNHMKIDDNREVYHATTGLYLGKLVAGGGGFATSLEMRIPSDISQEEMDEVRQRLLKSSPHCSNCGAVTYVHHTKCGQCVVKLHEVKNVRCKDMHG